jgi:hypothetical protein
MTWSPSWPHGAGSRRVMISSRDQSALLYLHSRLPEVTLLFSAAAVPAGRDRNATGGQGAVSHSEHRGASGPT